jgi:hypothetical protein
MRAGRGAIVIDGHQWSIAATSDALCSTVIDAPIEQVYLAATYVVMHEGKPVAFSFTRRGGDVPAALGLPATWAIVTSDNPMSRPASDMANTRRAAEFMEWIHAERFASEPARSSAADGSWVETGRVLLDLSREQALVIARRFGQRALVWGEREKAGVLDCRTERWTMRPICLPQPPR